MLTRSKKFGTVLSVGPRLGRLANVGLADDLLWEERYPDQEKPSSDGKGEFQQTREWIETAPLELVFDLWCRGHNLIGYARSLLYATSEFRKAFK